MTDIRGPAQVVRVGGANWLSTNQIVVEWEQCLAISDSQATHESEVE